MNRNISKARNLSHIALCAVFVAVCSWISIPAAIPFTMQIFGVFFALDFLGAKRGCVSILMYLLMGAVGIPVFSNFTGGFGVIIGPNGGYMLGWIAAAAVTGLFERFGSRGVLLRLLSMILGLCACYVFGTVWFTAVYNRTSGEIGLIGSMLLCVVPFVIPDLIKIWLALLLGRRIKRIVGCV